MQAQPAREANAGLQSVASQSVPECQSPALALSQSKKGQKPFHRGCPEDCRLEHNHFPARAIRRGSGVQESGYVLVGNLLGIPGETAFALSLIARVRELGFGIPGLIGWQLIEGRRLLRARAEPASW